MKQLFYARKRFELRNYLVIILLSYLPPTIAVTQGQISRAVNQSILVSPVVYGDEVKRFAETPHPDVTRVYFDFEGSVYPAYGSQVVVADERLLAERGLLRNHFQTRTNRARRDQQLLDYNRLQDYYGVPRAPISYEHLSNEQREANNLSAWRTLQMAMQKRFIEEFNQSIAQTRPAALIVLVHGFNNKVKDATWYQTLEQRVRTEYFNGQRVTFLEVRWDGGAIMTPLGAPKTWMQAQATMYPVGMALRRILHGLDKSLPVYVIGHSTGAPLLSIALWNSTAALQRYRYGVIPIDFKIWGEPYDDLIHRPEYATPIPEHLRVAFVAPAMPATPFVDYLNRTPSDTITAGGNRGQYERLVIGQNHNDIITSKLHLGPKWFGYTTLGYQKKAFCTTVVPQVTASGSLTQPYLVDFTDQLAHLGFGSEHGIEYFLQAPAASKCLLDLWLTSVTAAPCADKCP